MFDIKTSLSYEEVIKGNTTKNVGRRALLRSIRTSVCINFYILFIFMLFPFRFYDAHDIYQFLKFMFFVISAFPHLVPNFVSFFKKEES